MTEPDETVDMAPQVKPGPTKPVTFKGRKIETIEPSEEQFVALLRLANLPRSTDGISAHRMMATLNRVPNLCRALCASEVDAEWFEDGLVDGALKIIDLPDFCAEVMVVWWSGAEPPNRAAKRATKKAPGARLAK